MNIQAPLTLGQKQRRATMLAPYEERLRALRRDAKASHAVLLRLWDERRELLTEVRTLEQWLETATGTRMLNPPARADTPQVAGVRLDVEHARKRLGEVDAAIAEAQAVWDPQARLIGAAEEWLQTNTPRLCEYG